MMSVTAQQRISTPRELQPRIKKHLSILGPSGGSAELLDGFRTDLELLAGSKPDTKILRAVHPPLRRLRSFASTLRDDYLRKFKAVDREFREAVFADLDAMLRSQDPPHLQSERPAVTETLAEMVDLAYELADANSASAKARSWVRLLVPVLPANILPYQKIFDRSRASLASSREDSVEMDPIVDLWQNYATRYFSDNSGTKLELEKLKQASDTDLALLANEALNLYTLSLGAHKAGLMTTDTLALAKKHSLAVKKLTNFCRSANELNDETLFKLLSIMKDTSRAVWQASRSQHLGQAQG